ncbi:MAG: hypothetical protein JXA69_20370 [Phycisphaerae bacterium]|nr:hypothetical protein [Phycisphaerae bacterium]
MLDRLTRSDAEARKAQNEFAFDKVEAIRQQRERALRSAARSPSTDLSEPEKAWIEDAKAVAEAETMIQSLQYDEAYERVKTRWARFANQKPGDGPVYGDLAMMMAKATMCSLLIYEEPKAPLDEVEAALAKAIELDPCQVEARATLAYLRRPNPREAFTRAEVRPSLLARNKALLNLSYDPQRGGPVMPWHAPVELLKAESTESILRDYLYIDFLSGAPLRGIDASGGRFALYPGFLFVESVDRSGRPGWFVLSPTPRGKRIQWYKYAIYLLRWTPPEDTTQRSGMPTPENPDADVRALLKHLDTAEPNWTKDADDGSRLALYATQNMDIGELLKTASYRLIGLRRSSSLRTDFGGTGSSRRTRRSQDTTTDGAELRMRSSNMDWSLTTQAGGMQESEERSVVLSFRNTQDVSPYLIVADGQTTDPPFFVENDSRHLVLNDGIKLVVDEANNLFVSDDGAVLRVQPFPSAPLPPFILEELANMSTTQGQTTVLGMLKDAGYTDETALRLLARAVSTSGSVPRGMDSSAGSTFLTAIRELRERLQSLRFLQDAVGNYVFRRPAGTMGGSSATEGQGPFVMIDRTGTPIEERYTMQDWHDLFTNVNDTFIPQAIDYRPNIPLLKVATGFLHDYLRLTSSGAQGGYRQPTPRVAPPQPMLQPGEEPKPPSEDELRQMLADLVQNEVNDVHATLPAPEPVGWPTPGSQQTPYGQPRYGYGGAPANPYGGPSGPQASDQLATVWHAQAGIEASEKRYHRALAYFQDVLSLMTDQQLGHEFFQQVPNPELIQTFAQNLSAYVAAQLVVVTVETEQAVVLDEVAFSDASGFLKKRMIDRFELYTFPMLDEAIAYAQSYGFSPSPELSATRRQIETVIASVRGSLKADTGSAHIDEALAAKDAAATADSVKKIKAALGAKTTTPNSEDEDAEKAAVPEFVGGMLRSLFDSELSLASWLELKGYLAEQAPAYLWRSDETIARRIAANMTPAETYDLEEGFPAAPPALTAERLKQLNQWAALTAEQRQVDESAGLYHFILAWYWLDRGQWHHARDAYILAARAYLARAATREGGRDVVAKALIAKRNAAMMMVAGAGITFDTPPGAKTVGASYTEELKAQMEMWFRRWASIGLPEAHASREKAVIEERIDAIIRAERQSETEAHRYFWFDYDAVPSVLLDGTVKLGGEAGPS